MARKKAATVYQPSADNDVWGIPAEKWREVLSFLLAVLAIFIVLSLVANGLGHGWAGVVGSGVAASLHFVLGDWAAYALPVLLVLAGVHALRGRTPLHPARKAVSAVLILVSLCAWRSLYWVLLINPAASMADKHSFEQHAFEAGGVVGGFLTSGANYSLHLGEVFGPVGAYLLFAVLFVLGTMLSTDFLFLPFLHRLLGTARSRVAEWKRPLPVVTLRFAREESGRIFPAMGATDRAEELLAARRQHEFFTTDVPEEAASESPPKPSITLNLSRAQAAADDGAGTDEDFQETAEVLGSETLRRTAGAGRKAKERPAGAPTADAMMQTELDFSAANNYRPPASDIFTPAPPATNTMDREEALEVSAELENALADFNISARVVAVTQGPVVTQYELQPAPGVKVSRILSLENDIALILKAKSVRIQAPIPGRAAVGIEVPNRKVTPVYFRELIEAAEFRGHESPLAFVLGRNISGEPVICDLATMPHLLIAGTTGSGKSVCVNVIICSILYRMPPDRVKFIMIDPKRVELNVYSDVPHLLAPVVNEPKQAAAGLMWAVQQMEERLTLFSRLRVRNIDGYNDIAKGKRPPPRGMDVSDLHPIPHIVIIIDELADLMIIAKNEVEEFIVRLAQMSRAAGIHMIIATQRPSVNVLTGIIKANFPSRIAFRVSAKVDSRTILDMNGAEALLGKGDMLFSPGGMKPMRIQGAFVADPDVEKLTEYLRAQIPAAYEKQEFSTSELERREAMAAQRAEEGTEDNAPWNTHEQAGGTAGFEGGDDEGTGTGEEPETSFDVAPGHRVLPPKRLQIPTEMSPLAPRRPASQIEFPNIHLSGDGGDGDEELYDKALILVLETRKPSVSLIQRRMKIGFARAGRLMDLMEERGIVGPYLGSKPRDLLVDDPDSMLERLHETS